MKWLFAFAAVSLGLCCCNAEEGVSRASLSAGESAKNSVRWSSENEPDSAIFPQPPGSNFQKVKPDGSSTAKALKIERSTGGECGVKWNVSAELVDESMAFRYFIPENANAFEVQVSIWVKDDKGSKEYVTHLNPIKGRWVSDQWRLSDIIGGDVWRLDPKIRQVEAVGIRLKMDGGSWLLDKVELKKVAALYGPMTVPLNIATAGVKEGAVHLTREFNVEGSVAEGWGQVLLKEPWKVWLNGKPVASSDAYPDDKSRWPDVGNASRGMWKKAVEFDLADLAQGRNVLEVEIPVNSTAVVAAGWLEDGKTRAVVVSDANWKAVNSQTQEPVKTALSGIASRADVKDIYPLRLPHVWWKQTVVENKGKWPKMETYSTPLKPRVLKGKWSIAQFPEYGNRWFFKDPAGKPFFALGSQTLGLLRQNYCYYRYVTETWPSQEAWLHDAMTSLKGMGFNSVAVAATSTVAFNEAGKEGMVGFEFIGSSLRGPFLTNAAGKQLSSVPDPFDDEWRATFRNAAETKAAAWKQQDNIIGLFVNNEMTADGNTTNGSMLGYVYSKACGQKFIEWLKAKYSDIETLNHAWYGDRQQRYHQSFEAILVDKPNPESYRYLINSVPGLAETRTNLEIEPALPRDFSNFSACVMQEYAGYMLQVLREVMPDLIIGTNRFQGGITDELLFAWKDYDMIAWNDYPIWERGQKVFSQTQLDKIKRAFELTGKPVLVTEWGTAAYEARLPGSVVSFATYKEQGEGYRTVLEQLYRFPFVLGSIHFAWQDLSDSERQAWGIIDSTGCPREGLVKGIAGAHQWLDAELNKAASKKDPRKAR
ncbi:MAG: beta-galactosidase [Chthoniobacteraceae bacterium]